MTDRRFHDIVIESTKMIGPAGEHHTANCKTCSKQHKVTKEEFTMTDLYTLTDDGEFEQANALEHRDNYKEILQYVAEMRSWQCCHEGQEPLDGFPDQPDEDDRINFGQ